MLQMYSNNTIRMVRGDSISFKIYINNYSEKDCFYFALMEPNQSFECAILRLVFDTTSITNDGLEIKLESIQTEFLAPGDYYWTLKQGHTSLDSEGNVQIDAVDTLVQKTRFTIMD